VEALVMEIDKDRILAQQDAVHGAIMEVQKAERAAMAGFSTGGSSKSESCCFRHIWQNPQVD
jgi:hypothetical protein